LLFSGLGFFLALGVKGAGGIFSSRFSTSSSRLRGFAMRPDLLDAKAAIDWAVAQLPTLTERIIKWRRDKPYTVTIDTDSEPGKKLYRLSLIMPLDPIINAEAGAVIHSIRSSLDLLACALAARNGFPDSTSTYFPVWKSKQDFDAPVGRKRNPTLEKIKRLSQFNQAIIKALKPYPGGNDLLCALHDLDLTRKHRRLLNTFIFPRGIGFDPGISPITLGDWRGFNEETVLVETASDQPDSNVTIGLHVAFDEAGATHGHDCVGAIRDFARMASNILTLFCPVGT
jgi:hypothetical protein